MFNFIKRFRQKGRVSLTQLNLLYVYTLFIALHSAVPSYGNSSYLESFLSEQTVGVIFAVSSLVALFAIINLPRLLQRFGIYKTATALLVGDVLMLTTMGASTTPYIMIGAFMIHFFLTRALAYVLDIFTENLSSDESTGTIRGTLLTVINTAFLFGPLILSMLLGDGERFGLMYLFAAAMLIPAYIILVRGFEHFKDPEYERLEARKTTIKVLRNTDLLNIFASGFLLRFFYAWMMVYTPIYLIRTIGFEWSALGPVFTIMLLPFVIFQIPLGKIADRFLGEQELMISGFIIMGLSTAALSFLTEPNIALWALVLFATRIGASFVETMTESYFFKQIGPKDTGIVALYRTLEPLAFVIAPVISTIALMFIDIRYTFVILAGIVMLGVFFSTKIRDSR